MEVAAAAGHDGTETTYGTVSTAQGQGPSLPWHRRGQQLREHEREQFPNGSHGEVPAGLWGHARRWLMGCTHSRR